MENIELGEVIAVDGMPDWLRDDEAVAGQWRGDCWYDQLTWKHCYASPESITAIRLPADHPYYLAQAKGFTYWPGGEGAPVDWDGGSVLLRSGDAEGYGAIWYHQDCSSDIIGYRRKAKPVVTITVSQITRAEAYDDGLDIDTLERLGLLKDETLLEQFERHHGGLDSNQRDIVAAYQEWVAAL